MKVDMVWICPTIGDEFATSMIFMASSRGTNMGTCRWITHLRCTSIVMPKKIEAYYCFVRFYLPIFLRCEDNESNSQTKTSDHSQACAPTFKLSLSGTWSFRRTRRNTQGLPKNVLIRSNPQLSQEVPSENGRQYLFSLHLDHRSIS